MGLGVGDFGLRPGGAKGAYAPEGLRPPARGATRAYASEGFVVSFQLFLKSATTRVKSSSKASSESFPDQPEMR